MRFVGLTLLQALFLGIAFTATDIAVTFKSLVRLKQLRSEFGKFTIGVSVIDTLAAIFLLTFFTALIEANFNLFQVLMVLGQMGLFFLIILAANHIIPRLIRGTISMRVEEAEFAAIFCLILVLSFFAEKLHLISIVGAFFAGVILNRSKVPGVTDFYHKAKTLGYGFFIPVFFAYIGLMVNLTKIKGILIPALVLVAAAIVIKFLVALGSSKKAGFGLAEATTISVGLIPRADDNLIILLIALGLGIFTATTADFFMTTFMLLLFVSAIITPILLSLLIKKFLPPSEAESSFS